METTLDFNVVEVDPVTGEILPTLADNVDADSLANLGRWIKSKQRALDHLNNPRPASECQCENCNLSREIRKLDEIHQQRRERLVFDIKEQLVLAGGFVAATGQKVVNHPGIGRFRFRKLPDKLDRSKYEGLTDQQRTELHTERQRYFRYEQEVRIDWKQLTSDVKDGTYNDNLRNPDLNGLFSMITGADRFEFKPE